MKYARSFCECREEFDPVHVYIFSGTFVDTKQPHSVTVPAAELFAYNCGDLIQDALKSVSADDREFLKTGLSRLDEVWKLAGDLFGIEVRG